MRRRDRAKEQTCWSGVIVERPLWSGSVTVVRKRVFYLRQVSMPEPSSGADAALRTVDGKCGGVRADAGHCGS